MGGLVIGVFLVFHFFSPLQQPMTERSRVDKMFVFFVCSSVFVFPLPPRSSPVTRSTFTVSDGLHYYFSTTEMTSSLKYGGLLYFLLVEGRVVTSITLTKADSTIIGGDEYR